MTFPLASTGKLIPSRDRKTRLRNLLLNHYSTSKMFQEVKAASNLTTSLTLASFLPSQKNNLLLTQSHHMYIDNLEALVTLKSLFLNPQSSHRPRPQNQSKLHKKPNKYSHSTTRLRVLDKHLSQVLSRKKMLQKPPRPRVRLAFDIGDHEASLLGRQQRNQDKEFQSDH